MEKLSIGASNECFDDNVIGEFLYQLIPQCRQLRFLDLTHYPPNFFELVANHCLQLEEVAIIDTYEYTEDIWKKEYKEQRQPATGLKRLQYESHGEGFSELRDLVPLWIRSKDTLQAVVLRLCESDIRAMTQEDWDSLFCHNYPQVKSLLIERQEDDSVVPDQTLKLLQLCPVLEHVLLSIKAVLPNDFFASFTELAHLCRLDLFRLDISCSGLYQYIEYRSEFGQKSNLKELLLFHCKGLTDQDIGAFGNASSLEKININGKYPLVSSSGIATFLQKLKSNPNLQFLALSGMTNLTEDCLPDMEELVELDKTGLKHHFEKHNLMFDKRKYSSYL